MIDERRSFGNEPSEEWARGLWALDAGVREAVAGGWTRDPHRLRTLAVELAEALDRIERIAKLKDWTMGARLAEIERQASTRASKAREAGLLGDDS